MTEWPIYYVCINTSPILPHVYLWSFYKVCIIVVSWEVLVQVTPYLLSVQKSILCANPVAEDTFPCSQEVTAPTHHPLSKGLKTEVLLR